MTGEKTSTQSAAMCHALWLKIADLVGGFLFLMMAAAVVAVVAAATARAVAFAFSSSVSSRLVRRMVPGAMSAWPSAHRDTSP